MSGPSAMAREVAEAPEVVARLLREGDRDVARAARVFEAARPRWVSFVARGTSDHVATYGRYLVETTLGLPAMLAASSVTTVYGATLDWRDGALVAVSQSGQSPDLVSVVRAARLGGATTIAVTNDAASPLARAAAVVVPCRAGPERAVAATKTYIACLAAVAAIVATVGADARLRAGLERLPATLRRAVAEGQAWVERSGVVAAFAASDRAILTSRGYDLATVLEIAIKLQETSRMFADAYSSADLEHGPIALAGADVTTLVIRPDGEMGRRVDGVLERLRATGARPWVIGGQEAPLADDRDDRDRVVQLPIDVPTELAPAAFIIPGQLLAEAVARARSHDPDRPIGLTKVTRTH